MEVEEARSIVRSKFRKQLLDCMNLCGYSGRKLSQELGCQPCVIKAWMDGSSIPSSTHMLALSETLGVTIELLLTGKEK